jgi:hypothetical protein
MPHKSRQCLGGLRVWMKCRYYMRGWLYLGIVCGVLDVALLGVWGLAPTMQLALAPGAIEPDMGQAYDIIPGSLRLRFPYWVPSDDATHPRVSRLHLLEDGRPLGPSHSLHQMIREVGQGAFSHWMGNVRFSTSDGTDPRTNGRRYTIRVTADVVAAVWWGIAACNGIVLAVGAYWLRQRFGAAWWTWYSGGLEGDFARMGDRLRGFPIIKPVCDGVAAVERVFATTSGWCGALLRTMSLLLQFLLYGVLLQCPLPASLLFVAYSGLMAIALPAGLLLYGAYRWPGWLGTLASLTLTLSLFALPLLALWSHVGLHRGAVGGCCLGTTPAGTITRPGGCSTGIC